MAEHEHLAWLGVHVVARKKGASGRAKPISNKYQTRSAAEAFRLLWLQQNPTFEAWLEDVIRKR